MQPVNVVGRQCALTTSYQSRPLERELHYQLHEQYLVLGCFKLARRYSVTAIYDFIFSVFGPRRSTLIVLVLTDDDMIRGPSVAERRISHHIPTSYDLGTI